MTSVRLFVFALPFTLLLSPIINAQSASTTETTQDPSKTEVVIAPELAQSDAGEKKLQKAFEDIRNERDALQAQFDTLQAKQKEFDIAKKDRDSYKKALSQAETDIAQLKEQLKVAQDQERKNQQDKRLQENTLALAQITEERDQLLNAQNTLTIELSTLKQQLAQLSAKSYIVQAGDSLSKIAATQMGNADLWPLLYKSNRPLLKTPEDLQKDMTLTIPARCEIAP